MKKIFYKPETGIPGNSQHQIHPSPEPRGNPSEEQRQAAKAKIMEAVGSRLESRIDEVFKMADEDHEPEMGARITWRDLNEVRCQICGCLAEDLHYGLGDWAEDILRDEIR